MEIRKEGISMLVDILDYLNNHQVREVLDRNTVKLKALEEVMKRVNKTDWDTGTVTEHRQLVEIRQALHARLCMPGDRDAWLKV